MQNLLSNKLIKTSFSLSHTFFLPFPFHFTLYLHFTHFHLSFLSFLFCLLHLFPLSYITSPSLSSFLHPSSFPFPSSSPSLSYLHFPSLSCLLYPLEMFLPNIHKILFPFFLPLFDPSKPSLDRTKADQSAFFLPSHNSPPI